ncbi:MULTISPECIES: lysine exporter LysO family protein [unclassified Vibrio]|uniref:Lysine exporter LysO family protein n=1 Tax=Vibrio sp. HB236076 TaxID=3232307 RepID=A0AB39H862_9VIBR|nr:lysine exporter LysO family protein [Vibrio sp. HB161653]MDP5253593.1 lysine exporter LysO family protein [Vibrio sp. HB161653]
MYSSMLFIFIPLVVGYLLTFKDPKWRARAGKATQWLIYVILFLMGISITSVDNLAANTSAMLTYSLGYFLVIGGCNLAFLPVVDRFWPVTLEEKRYRPPLIKMAMSSIKLISVVALGGLIGIVMNLPTDAVDSASEFCLYALLFFIGYDLRHSGLSLQQILLNKQGMLLSAIIVLSSMLAGVLMTLFTDVPLFQSLAMASGFGWYSLSGILIGDAYGPVFGGASFILELLRELAAILIIPVFIYRYPSTVIGYAGATAMDFTLPIIQSSGGVRCVPIAIVSGFILSVLVPVLMLFFISLSQGLA